MRKRNSDWLSCDGVCRPVKTLDFSECQAIATYPSCEAIRAFKKKFKIFLKKGLPKPERYVYY
jgi:hypothetical protein